MIFTPTEIDGAFIIDVERLADSRGFFARAWCREEFAQHGLVTDLSQANIAWSAKRGTLRGLHFQAAPHEEAKLVRCTQGAAYRGGGRYSRQFAQPRPLDRRRT